MAERSGIMPTVGQVLGWINEIAPFEHAEKWDNSGLLCGSASNEVDKVLFALDMNEHVLDKALEIGAQLIVIHHPILFSGRKTLCEDDTEGKMLCRMVRSKLSLIAAHTNYDVAVGGVNDILAKELGLYNIKADESDEMPLIRIGDIKPVSLKEFAKTITDALGDVVRVYGQADSIIKRVAVCGGAGGEYAQLALSMGADAYVTGEMRYHDSIDLAARGMATLHAGHDATERIAIKPLAEGLQKRADELQYNVEMCVIDMGVYQ